MGRKIPGKKHKGVKDPLEQMARRNESLKMKLNAPPVNPDAQEVPKSVRELSKLISMAKEGKFERKKKKKKNICLDLNRLAGREHTLPGMRKVEKKFPNLVQEPGESDESFLQRVDEMTQEFINEVEIEKHQEVVSDVDEEIEIDDQIEDEMEGSKSKKKKLKKPSDTSQKFKKTNKRKLDKTDEDNEKAKLRSLNKRQRIKFKKAQRQEVDEFSKFTDNVKFGEIVDQPPQLTARPKGVNEPRNSKPGSKNLLLKNLLNPEISGKSVKPKLSAAAQRNLEAQREAAVAAYREIKARRKMKDT